MPVLWLDRLALACLMLPYLALTWPAVAARLQRWARRLPVALALPLALLLPLAAATLTKAGTAGLLPLAGLGLLAGLIVALAWLTRPLADRQPLWALLPALPLWLIIELGLLPELPLRLGPGGPPLPGGLMMAIDLGLLAYLVIQPLPRIGFDLRLGLADGRAIVLALAAYGAVALPLGAGLGFLAFGVDHDLAAKALPMAVVIYWLNALPEELLFRGVVQNRLEHGPIGRWGALGIAALIFGLAHVNNPTALHPDVPNWPYVLMATLAGLAYGWTWRQTGKVTASAVVHGAVNFIWLAWLDGGTV